MKLKNILFEAEDGDAAEQAHKLGLTYDGWGKWKDKTGKTVAKTVQDNLVKIEPGEEPAEKHYDADDTDTKSDEPMPSMKSMIPKPVGAPHPDDIDSYTLPDSEEDEFSEPDIDKTSAAPLEPDMMTDFEPTGAPETTGDFHASHSPLAADDDEYVPPPGEYASAEGGLEPLLGHVGNDVDRLRVSLAKALQGAQSNPEKQAKIKAALEALDAKEKAETGKMREKLAQLAAKKKADVEARRAKYPMAAKNPHKDL